MSGCDRFGPELSAYLDGELEAGPRADLESHLAGCAECTRALEGYRWLDDEIRALPRVEPSPWFEARLRARLAREADRTRGGSGFASRWRPLEWAWGAAALGVLAILLSLGEPALPEEDWSIVADAEHFELLTLTDGDLELLAALELLETWDGAGEI